MKKEKLIHGTVSYPGYPHRLYNNHYLHVTVDNELDIVQIFNPNSRCYYQLPLSELKKFINNI